MLRLSIWCGHATAFSQMLSDLSLFTSLLSFWLQIYLKSVLNCLLISAKEIEKQVPSKTISLYTQLQKRWHLRSVCYGRLITFKPSPIASWFSAFSRASSNLLVFTLYSYWLLFWCPLILIGCCDQFGLCFTTLSRNALKKKIWIINTVNHLFYIRANFSHEVVGSHRSWIVNI